MGKIARKTPVIPPIVNSVIMPTAKSSGVLNSIDPCQSVPIQLKI